MVQPLGTSYFTIWSQWQVAQNEADTTQDLRFPCWFVESALANVTNEALDYGRDHGSHLFIFAVFIRPLSLSVTAVTHLWQDFATADKILPRCGGRQPRCCSSFQNLRLSWTTDAAAARTPHLESLYVTIPIAHWPKRQ